MRTVGSILKDARLKQNKNLEEVEKDTKIRKSILIALENGDWESLPPPTFIKGFIRNYGQYLGLNSSELLAFFRREYDEKKAPAKIVSPSSVKKTRFRLTPGVLVVLIISIVLVFVSGYLFIQYRSFTGAPLLEVTDPKDNLKTSATDVLVVGRTYSDSTLKINGQDVQLSTGGTFSVDVALVDGVNDLVITSANRFGKISTEKRTVVVETPVVSITPTPVASSSATLTPTPSSNVAVTLKIGPQSSWVHIETDGSLSFEGVLVSGSTKTFSAKEVVKVITGNGGSTKVQVNGGSEDLLGSEGQRVEKEYRK